MEIKIKKEAYRSRKIWRFARRSIEKVELVVVRHFAGFLMDEKMEKVFGLVRPTCRHAEN